MDSDARTQTWLAVARRSGLSLTHLRLQKMLVLLCYVNASLLTAAYKAVLQRLLGTVIKRYLACIVMALLKSLYILESNHFN